MIVRRFFLFNLAGNILPVLVALVAVPVIAAHAGVERLGALGVVWGVVGYFGFLDFGLSRVVTRRVALAHELGRLADELSELRGFLWRRAGPAVVVLTLLLFAAKLPCAPYFPAGWLGTELARGWTAVVLCVPLTLMTNWLRGALEGVQRFARVNLLRSVFGAWNYAAPALIVLTVPTLDAMIAVICLGRFLAVLAHGWACWRVERGMLFGPLPARLVHLPAFFREGGWMTVSNLVAPLMVYSDRFMLAAMVPASAVAWYVTSQEMLLRALVLPAALAGVLFPRFSENAAENVAEAQDAGKTGLYRHSVRLISAIMLPICTLFGVLAYHALRFWLGASFALHSYRIVEIISIGIFMNSIAHLPFARLQGAGRSHVAARIHLIQLPLYAAALYAAVRAGGIEGAAWAWTVRVSIDCLAMMLTAAPEARFAALPATAVGAVFLCCTAFLFGPADGFSPQFAATVAAIGLASLALAWFGLLKREDRMQLMGRRHAL
jgi:O-antigen/teichoic acid export membrane protein